MTQAPGVLTWPSLDAHFWLLVGVILLFGALGGLINYCLPGESDQETNGPRKSLLIVKSMLVGVGASFLVPLFLNMISSDLLASSRNDPLKLLVFAGFCLIAAISARTFIAALSDKVLRDLKETKKRLVAAEEKASLADEKATAVVETVSDPAFAKGSEAKDSLKVFSVDREDIDLLRQLGEGKYKFRTVEGLARESDIGPLVLIQRLMRLQDRGLAASFESGSRVLWYVTPQGRGAYQS